MLGAGASTEYFGIDRAAKHALPLYRLTDALRLRNHIVERFEHVDADRTQIADGALTFVVVGGGPNGVEMAGALIELVDMALAQVDGCPPGVGRAGAVPDDDCPVWRPWRDKRAGTSPGRSAAGSSAARPRGSGTRARAS